MGNIYNLNTDVQVDADYNWWGDNGFAASGPGDRVLTGNALLGDPTDPTDPYFNPGCAQQQPDPTPTPASNTCITQATETTVGVYIRQTPNMFDPNGSVNVRGGQLTVTGVYSNEQGLWLRVTGYTVGGIFTSSIGWVWRDVFAASDPCEVGEISNLPIMDDDGNPIATPVPVPTPTPVPPQPTPEFPAACRVWTSQPANIRYAWYSYSPSLYLIDQSTWVNVYAATDDGDMPPGTTSTNWYQVSFESSTGTLYGWMHEMVLDSNLIHGPDCADIPWVERTLPPTNTPTPQPPTPTPPPDISSVFPLPMIGDINEDGIEDWPPRLTGCDFHIIAGIDQPDDRNGVDDYPFRLGSLDINPLGHTGNFPVVLPAEAEVTVVDQVYGENDGYNAGLGNFIAVRIDVANIPTVVRTRLITHNPPFPIEVSEHGSLTIAFAHLQDARIPSYVFPSAILPAGTVIGYSGRTGASHYTDHLDVSVFYTPGPRPPTPSGLAGIPGAPGVDDYLAYYWMYTIGRSQFGGSTPVHPLALWPSLQTGTGCPYPEYPEMS